MHYYLWGAGLRHTSVGRVFRCADVVVCVLLPVAIGWGLPWPAYSSLRGPSSLGGTRFIAWRLRRPFVWECRRGSRHFWECQACLGYSPAPEPTKKKSELCHTHPVGGTEDKYWKPPSRVERIHYSLGGAGLGHTSVDRVFSVLGSGRGCPASSGSRSRFALTGIVEPLGPCPRL